LREVRRGARQFLERRRRGFDIALLQVLAKLRLGRSVAVL
jgi:hypothetical protein